MERCVCDSGSPLSRGYQGLGPPPPPNAILTRLTRRATLNLEPAQVRQRLAGRPAEHVLPARAAVQAAEAIGDSARLYADERLELVEPFAMLAVHRVEPRVQARERIAMPRQHEHVGGHFALQLGDRGEPFA